MMNEWYNIIIIYTIGYTDDRRLLENRVLYKPKSRIRLLLTIVHLLIKYFKKLHKMTMHLVHSIINYILFQRFMIY